MGALANYIMRGRTQAVIVTSILALLSLALPPLSIVSSASVALVTLRLGATEGSYIGLSAIITTLLSLVLIDNNQLPVLLRYSILLMPVNVWIVALVLRETRQLFLSIEIAISSIIVCMLGAYWYLPDLAEQWKSALHILLEPMLIQANPNVSSAEIAQVLDVFYHFVITGLVAAIYTTGLLASLFLGRWWQAILYNPGGFKQEYLALRSKPSLAIIAVVTLFIALAFSGLSAEICSNITLLLSMLYALIGTVVLHCLFSEMQMKKILVPFLYITMLIIPHAVALAAIIGISDTWLDLRNKFKNQTSV